MPELPEVEVVRRGLEPHVKGARITAVRVHDARSVRHQEGGTAAFCSALQDTRVVGVARRGKFLWWRLLTPSGTPHPHALITHLGMSGQMRVRRERISREGIGSPRGRTSHEGPTSDPVRHRRIEIALEGPAGPVGVDLIDQRIFGGMWMSPLVGHAEAPPAGEGSPDGLLPRAAEHIGRDVLDPHLDARSLIRTWGERRAPIKSLLLNQALSSGIGNIYADEALWGARIRYDTPGTAISRPRRAQLLEQTQDVMRRALAVGGTSFDALYVNVDGRSGYFARSLNAYGREGEQCSRCGSFISRDMHQGRSSYYCRRCQRRQSIRS